MNRITEKKIICTLGPASLHDSIITRMEDFGVSLLRINLSHTNISDLPDVIRFIQRNTAIPVCLDTEGAQIRTGILDNGSIKLEDNSFIRVNKSVTQGDTSAFNFCPDWVVDELKTGDFISIDFNSVLAQVVEHDETGVLLRILTGGLMGQNKAVTVERDITLPPLSQKDREALEIGVKMGIRHIAFSFANSASDVIEVRKSAGRDVTVISKIESLNGVINLEEIASESDALLLDRGDLSRQVPIERIPKLQKDIIYRAKKAGSQIYVATNLLESMMVTQNPTRAEVNDVYNTLSDGADGLVLAAETAIGNYPINCVAMVSKIIRQFVDFPFGYSAQELQKRDYFLLVEPNGGVLVNRMSDKYSSNDAGEVKKLEVQDTVLWDAEQIATGTFSPLEGFLNRLELESVLSTCRLPDGTIWPLPIVLPASSENVSGLEIGDTIGLTPISSSEVYVLLKIDEIYTFDTASLAEHIPEVDGNTFSGEYYIAGKVELVNRVNSPYKHFQMTPAQTRTIFENKGWSRIAGFCTRYVPSRLDEYNQMTAIQAYSLDGVFLHPVIDIEKSGNNTHAVMKGHEWLIANCYPRDRFVLGAIQNYPRQAGQREILFEAVCAKNFGCSHFIVNPHNGLGSNSVESGSIREFLNKFPDIGITPIFTDGIHYCVECGSFTGSCEHSEVSCRTISNEEAAVSLRSGQIPDDWFIREEVSKISVKEASKESS